MGAVRRLGALMFTAFPKIPRLSRDIVITEKLDGTNAQVIIDRVPNGCITGYELESGCVPLMYTFTPDNTLVAIWAGSRNRLIFPGKAKDNFGFAEWVFQHAAELVALGIGRHFGEWYGQGIQRGYGLYGKRFALFPSAATAASKPACCEVTTVLYDGPFSTDAVDAAMEDLRVNGSKHVPGFMRPEGVVIYHTAARTLFKKTFDDTHKEAAQQRMAA